MTGDSLMRHAALMSALTAIAAAAGCHHDKYGLKTTRAEEMVLPPDEARFNNPPESEYKKPTPKKEFRPGPGSMGGGPTRPGM
jgi:hypothetical protein